MEELGGGGGGGEFVPSDNGFAPLPETSHDKIPAYINFDNTIPVMNWTRMSPRSLFSTNSGILLNPPVWVFHFHLFAQLMIFCVFRPHSRGMSFKNLTLRVLRRLQMCTFIAQALATPGPSILSSGSSSRFGISHMYHCEVLY